MKIIRILTLLVILVSLVLVSCSEQKTVKEAIKTKLSTEELVSSALLDAKNKTGIDFDLLIPESVQNNDLNHLSFAYTSSSRYASANKVLTINIYNKKYIDNQGYSWSITSWENGDLIKLSMSGSSSILKSNSNPNTSVIKPIIAPNSRCYWVCTDKEIIPGHYEDSTSAQWVNESQGWMADAACAAIGGGIGALVGRPILGAIVLGGICYVPVKVWVVDHHWVPTRTVCHETRQYCNNIDSTAPLELPRN